MRIQSRALVAPPYNRVYATWAVAASIVVFAYSTIFGPVSILFFYVLWLPLLAVDVQRIIGRSRDLLLPLLYALYIFLSVLWSDAPWTSLRGSIQLGTHLLCALIAARTVDIASLLWGGVAGAFVVVLYSLAFGASAYDVMDGTYTFVGAFTSKNQLALYCSLGVLCALAVALTVRTSWIGIAFALFVGILSLATLASSRSATAILSLGSTVLVLFFLLGLLRFHTVARQTLLFFLVPFALILAVGAINLGALDLILGVFGKDSTLTGRTYLWGEGLAVWHEHWLFGVGFQAYWVQGFSEAERLWAEFYIAGRQGFHFHNTYVELLAELGIVGLLLFAALVLSTVARLVGRIVFLRDTEAATLFSLLFILLVRSVSEVDGLYPYTLGSFLFIFLHVASRRRAVRRPGGFGADTGTSLALLRDRLRAR